MAKRKRPQLSAMTPLEDGYYWATHRRHGWRDMVRLGRNGLRHRRAFVARMSCTFDPSEFTAFSRQIKERA